MIFGVKLNATPIPDYQECVKRVHLMVLRHMRTTPYFDHNSTPLTGSLKRCASQWYASMLTQLAGSSLPRNLHGPLLVDRRGLPRYWAAVWSAMSAAQLADSTHIKRLRCIEALYVHADNLYGASSLDVALGTVDEVALANIVESWFVAIRNQSNGVPDDEVRWRTGLNYVSTIITWLSGSHCADEHDRPPMTVRLHRLSTLYSQLHVRRVATFESIRSLPASTVLALYKMLDPESESNPFVRPPTRWRIYIAFVLMLHQGLRRG